MSIKKKLLAVSLATTTAMGALSAPAHAANPITALGQNVLRFHTGKWLLVPAGLQPIFAD